VDPLATVDDLATYLGVDEISNEDQAELLLDIASSTIRDETGQQLTLVDDDEITMRGSWTRELWLPQRPVTDVASITIDGALIAGTAYKWTSEGRVTWYPGLGGRAAFDGPDWQEAGHWGGDSVLVGVVYSHGYEEIPANVKGICLELSKRAIRAPGSGEIASESLGAYSVTYSRDAAQTLTTGEKHRLRAYKRKNATVLTCP